MVHLLGVYTLVVTTPSFAQTYRTWDNGALTGIWDTSTNWSADNLPGDATEVARFSNGNAATTSIGFTNDQRTGGMLFDANLTVDIAYTGATKELSIRLGGSNYGIVNNSAQTITFQNLMGIEANMTWAANHASGGGLVFQNTVDTDGFNLTFHTANTSNFINVTGSIIDSGGIIKTGTGVLTLSGNNTYTGTTTVTGGTLTLASGNSLGASSGGTIVNANGTLALTNDITIATEAIANSGTLKNTSGDNTLGGIISGSGNITTVAGSLTLSGLNTYSGNTTINSGSSLVLNANNALGIAGSTTVNSGGTLALMGDIRDANQSLVTIAGSGNLGAGAIRNISGTNTLKSNVTLNANATVTSANGTLNFGLESAGDSPYLSKTINLGSNTLTTHAESGATVAFRYNLTGTGGLTKTGSGNLLYNNGWNSYTGATKINDGTLFLSTYFYSASFPTNFGLTSDVTVGDNIGAAKSAVFQMGQSGDVDPFEYIRNTQNITINSDGYWNLQGFKETINNLTLNGGTVDAQQSGGAVADRLDAIGVISVGASTGTSTVNGLLGMNNDAAKSIVVGADATLDIEATLSNGGFLKTGSGTLELSGGNTFTGVAQIDAGIVRVNNQNGLGAVGSGAIGTGTLVTSTDAQLRLENVAITGEALSIIGDGVSGGGALRSHSGTNSWTGNITLTGNAEIETASGTTLSIGGNISGGGNALTVESIGNTTFNGINSFGTINKTGTGTLTITNTNSYGTANVSAGTFALGANNILTDSMDVNVTGSGNFNVGIYTETIDDLVGSGTLSVASGGNLTIDKIGGTLSGGTPGGGFTGTLDNDGIMTLNGGLISGGTGAGSTGEMILTAGQTLEIASNFTYGTVGTMGGDDQLGTLTLGNLSTLLISGGSTVNIGTLNIDGDSIIDFTAGENNDNTLNLGSLTFTSGSTLTINGWDRYGDLWTSQNFPGASLDIRDSNTAKITFSGFSNSQTIWLTSDFGSKEITIPEPSSYGAIFMAFGLTCWRLRRRPRSA